jgi:hypothetical protein
MYKVLLQKTKLYTEGLETAFAVMGPRVVLVGEASDARWPLVHEGCDNPTCLIMIPDAVC